MNPPRLLLLCCVAMLGIVAALLIMGEEPVHVEVVGEDGATETVALSAHGFEHPRFATMDAGGPGAERHEGILWLGWAFGACSIVFYVTCLSMGVRRPDGMRKYRMPMVVGGGIFVAIFTLLVLSYRGYMGEATHEFMLSFPRPTAWMIYGIWLFPISFIVLYYVKFESWFLTEDDLKRFEEILAERNRGDDA